MVRETILGGENEQPDPEDNSLRPQRLSEIVGQREVFERLEIAVDAATKRQEPLGHILLDGPPGLGKTTFALCLPKEMDASVQITTGATLKAPKDLVPYLTNAEENSVLFVDEIHRLPRAVEEYLYPVMEDFRLDIILGEGINARTLNLSLKPFTLIGATTRAGMLTGPLRDRFQIREHLEFYSLQELTEIVRRNAVKLSVKMEEAALGEIAKRSRGTPRLAINRLRWVRDYADSKADGTATLAIAKDALKMAGIDILGLDKLDRQYLETVIRVFAGGPVGLEAIAHTMNVSSDTLQDEVEPFLLRSELLVRTPRGRMVQSSGYEHLGLDVPPSSDKPQGRLF